MAERKNLLQSSLGVATATLSSRILGLLRVMLEARVLGGGSVAGAWFLAFAIPNLFRRLLGEGTLGTALIPVITHTENEEGIGKVRRDLAVVFAVLAGILAVIVIVVTLIAFGLQALAAHPEATRSFPLLATERIRIMLHLLPLLMPYAFFICLVGVIGAVLNARRIFVLPALGALLLNIFLIGGLLFGFHRGIPREELPLFLDRLTGLVLLSGTVQLLLVLVLLWRCGRFPAFSRASFRDCAVLKQLWRLVLPGLVGGAALQISFLADRLIAIWLGPQAVPALTNVDRLVDLPIGIFAVAMGSVLMANMAHLAAKGDWEALRGDLHFGLRHVYYACIPMAVLVMVFWRPLLTMLCLGGNFTESDLEATRLVAIFYGVGIPAFCSLKIILPVFYARKQMMPPLYASLTAIAVNIALNLILMWPLAQGGIALATVLASMLNNSILLGILMRQGFRLDWRLLLRTAGRSLAAAGIMGGGLFLLYPWLRKALTFPVVGEFPAFLVTAALFGAGYLALTALLRAPEPAELLSVLRRRRGS